MSFVIKTPKNPEVASLRPGMLFTDEDGDLNVVLDELVDAEEPDHGYIVAFLTPKEGGAGVPFIRCSSSTYFFEEENITILPEGTEVGVTLVSKAD